MSSVRWDGLSELKAALQNLPASLTAQASAIVNDAATTAATQIRDAYPARTGNLRGHVTVTNFEGGKFSAGKVVKNTSPHAWIFENGTQARHTALGANRGRMPPGHVFIPIAVRVRSAMYTQLANLLVENGLTVSGHV